MRQDAAAGPIRHHDRDLAFGEVALPSEFLRKGRKLPKIRVISSHGDVFWPLSGSEIGLMNRAVSELVFFRNSIGGMGLKMKLRNKKSDEMVSSRLPKLV